MDKNLNEILLEYLRIPSEITKEKAFCDHLEKRFHEKAPYLESFRLHQNLIFKNVHQSKQPTIGLFGHIDTVAPREDRPPFESDEYLHGCGASDMKGGACGHDCLDGRSTFDQ